MKITANFKTYRTVGYTHQVGTDPRATGGVHHHQIRQAPNGLYWHRIRETNGRFEDFGPTSEATPDQVAAALAAK